jgi:hypothetical protein
MIPSAVGPVADAVAQLQALQQEATEAPVSGETALPTGLPGQTGLAVSAMLAGLAADAGLHAPRQEAGHERSAMAAAAQLAAGGLLASAPLDHRLVFAGAPANAATPGRTEPATVDDKQAFDRARSDPALQAAVNPARLGVDAAVAVPLTPALLTALHTAPTRAPWPQVDDGHQRQQPRRPPTPWDDDEADAHAALPPTAAGDHLPQRRPATAELPAAAQAQPWCDELIAALRRAASRVSGQPALQVAAEAWLRGRAVLLACPQTDSDRSIGWLFVLWRCIDPQGPLLRGQRFAARLTWAQQADSQPLWWAVRVAKDHQAGRGRQLITRNELHAPRPVDAAGRVSCELQLGPVRPVLARWRDVRVRVDAVQRLWSALDVQWSLPLLVSSEPLLAGVAETVAGSAAGSAA